MPVPPPVSAGIDGIANRVAGDAGRMITDIRLENR